MSCDLGYIDEKEGKELRDRYESLSKQLYSLHRNWK